MAKTEKQEVQNMKLGIMQPYFLPYLGYWQLIQCVDTFVIYDDVNFIKGGWINRNRYLYQNQSKIFNIIMHDASSFKKINEIELMQSNGDYNPMKKLMSTFTMAYKKAPYYNETIEILEQIASCKEVSMSRFIENSIRVISGYLDIQTKILVSSDIEKTEGLMKEKRVMDICKRLGADIYINAIGGKELYDVSEFAENGIILKFIRMNSVEYSQFSGEFVPNLSIIDVLMFNGKERTARLLNEFTLEE